MVTRLIAEAEGINRMITLGENQYGKSRVRVMKVEKDGDRHEVFEWNVEVWLKGDFTQCFEDGDNSRILPTETMKNTVYSIAHASMPEESSTPLRLFRRALRVRPLR